MEKGSSQTFDMQLALGKLYELGFTDFERNLSVLISANMNVELAATIILDED
jgi:hypothetical protein